MIIEKFLSTPKDQLKDQPIYQVSFIAQYKAGDDDAFNKMFAAMYELAFAEFNCIGMYNATNEQGFEIALTYWHSMEDINRWKSDSRHQMAQQNGKEKWYDDYVITIAKITNQYCKIH